MLQNTDLMECVRLHLADEENLGDQDQVCSCFRAFIASRDPALQALVATFIPQVSRMEKLPQTDLRLNEHKPTGRLEMQMDERALHFSNLWIAF